MFLVLSWPTCFAADCRAPSYREGYVWEDSPTSVMMNISLRISDFSPERVVCLATALKHHYSGRRQIFIMMLSSYAAAKHFTHPFGGDSPVRRVNWSLQNHAIYSYDADKHEEYVVIMPFASELFDTRIDLPITSIPPCTLELAGRCLLALDKVEYPWGALKTKLSGTVTLEGVIGRDGTVKHVGLVGPEAHATEAQPLLVNAALQNLKTWRFETARHADPIRIAYSYTIDASGRPGHVSVQFELPHRVGIRGTPPSGMPTGRGPSH